MYYKCSKLKIRICLILTLHLNWNYHVSFLLRRTIDFFFFFVEEELLVDCFILVEVYQINGYGKIFFLAFLQFKSTYNFFSIPKCFFISHPKMLLLRSPFFKKIGRVVFLSKCLGILKCYFEQLKNVTKCNIFYLLLNLPLLPPLVLQRTNQNWQPLIRRSDSDIQFGRQGRNQIGS